MGFEAWLCRARKSLGICCTSQSAADMVRGLGSRALVSAQGCESADPGRGIMGWAHPRTSGKEKPAHCSGLCTSRPNFYNTATFCSVSCCCGCWVKRRVGHRVLEPGQVWLCWAAPGRAVWFTPGIASKRAVAARQLRPFLGCQQELMGLRAQWTPFLCRRWAQDAAVGPPFVPGRKLV